MRTIERSKCVVCGSSGAVLYRGLVDRLFSSPGEWSISECSNDVCGTLWLDPAPLQDDLGQAYLDYFTHERHGIPRMSRAKRAYLESAYGPKAQQSLGDRLLSRIFAFRYRRKLEADDQICHVDIGPPGLRVLDIGCGDGRTLWTLKQLGCDVVGVEFDGEAVATARELGLDVRLGSLDEQGFAPATFDAVLMSHVIEHLPDPKATLLECLRILKPGGQLRMLTPNAGAWGHRHFGRDWMALDPPRHLNIFTPSSMANLLRCVGFSDPMVESTPSGADRIAVMSRRIQRTGRGGILQRFEWLEKRYGRAMLVVERLVNANERDRGSQLVVVASKPLG